MLQTGFIPHLSAPIVWIATSAKSSLVDQVGLARVMFDPPKSCIFPVRRMVRYAVRQAFRTSGFPA